MEEAVLNALVGVENLLPVPIEKEHIQFLEQNHWTMNQYRADCCIMLPPLVNANSMYSFTVANIIGEHLKSKGVISDYINKSMFLFMYK